MPLTKVPTWLFIMDRQTSENCFLSHHVKSPSYIYSLLFPKMHEWKLFLYLSGTCRSSSSRPIHTCKQYVCFRASQFESESKTRQEQQQTSMYVWEHHNLKAKARQDKSRPVCMFQSITIWKRKQDKTTADQYVCLRASQSESESKTRAADQPVCMFGWIYSQRSCVYHWLITALLQ